VASSACEHLGASRAKLAVNRVPVHGGEACLILARPRVRFGRASFISVGHGPVVLSAPIRQKPFFGLERVRDTPVLPLLFTRQPAWNRAVAARRPGLFCFGLFGRGQGGFPRRGIWGHVLRPPGGFLLKSGST